MKRDDVRGQLSIEFLIVFTGLLIVVATVTMPTYNQARSDAEKIAKLSEAREAANTLANALNTVYANGPGSKLTIEYWLPQGVAALYMGGYDSLDVDGIYTVDESVPKNGRADVQIWMDLNNDGIWDNKRESVVLVDTILPSRWDENSAQRSEDWVRENCVHVGDDNLKVGLSYGTLGKKTLHRTTLEYDYNLGDTYPRKILVTDENIGGA